MSRLKKDADMQTLSASSQKKLWYRIDDQNRYYDRRSVRLLIWSGSVAASICLLILAGWYIFSSPQPVIADYAGVMQSFGSSGESSDHVRLILSNKQKITIEGKETQLEYKKEGWVNINKTANIEVDDYAIAGETVYNQLHVPAGKRSILTLNDGTQVWVNSGSKLVYPVDFAADKREIFIDGEIFLDVSPDPERPFIVHTGKLDVKVLGTRFNISAYANMSDMQVVLVSGKVEIHQDGVQKEILMPNQLFSYNAEKHDFYTSIVDVSDYIAWKEGYYPFVRQDLGTILSKLSNHYGVQFNWNEEIRKLSCSGKLDLKENIQDVLNTLEKTASIEIQQTSEKEYTVRVKP
jgi:hypothetical protein